jgi:hypothetical protein
VTLAAIGLTAAGLCCLVPVLVAPGPGTVGLFMAGVLLVLAGVVLSAVLLPGLLRRDDPDGP